MENLKKIKNIIENDFDIDTFNNVSTLLFYLPYLPFEFESNTAFVDSFYIASNKAYKLSVEYAKQLNGQGIECKAGSTADYKAAAVRCGNSRGKNTLIYREGMGSRFAIGAIEFKNILPVKHSKNAVKMPCLNCNICQKACPLGAISDTFDRSKCMREYMQKPERADKKTLRAFEHRFLGCDICQSVCPVNTCQSVKMPDDIKELLNFENLYKLIKEKKLEKFGEYFGANYCYINSLLAMLIITAGNSGDKNFKRIFEENALSVSKRVSFAASYALKGNL